MRRITCGVSSLRARAAAGARRPFRVAVGVAAGAWAVAVCVAVGVIAALVARGERVDAVLSSSMAPSIPRGSLVVSGPGPVELGDVIVYAQPGTGALVTHRVVGTRIGSGETSYITKGDANPTVDAEPVPAGAVRGLVRAHVPRVGGVLADLDTPAGAAVLVGPPALAGLAGVAGRRRPAVPAHHHSNQQQP